MVKTPDFMVTAVVMALPYHWYLMAIDGQTFWDFSLYAYSEPQVTGDPSQASNKDIV